MASDTPRGTCDPVWAPRTPGKLTSKTAHHNPEARALWPGEGVPGQDNLCSRATRVPRSLCPPWPPMAVSPTWIGPLLVGRRESLLPGTPTGGLAVLWPRPPCPDQGPAHWQEQPGPAGGLAASEAQQEAASPGGPACGHSRSPRAPGAAGLRAVLGRDLGAPQPGAEGLHIPPGPQQPGQRPLQGCPSRGRPRCPVASVHSSLKLGVCAGPGAACAASHHGTDPVSEGPAAGRAGWSRGLPPFLGRLTGWSWALT